MHNITSESLQSFELGDFGERLELHSAAEHNLVLSHMLEQTQRTCYILNRDLDRAVLHQDNIRTGLFNLARRGRFSDIRILAHDTDTAVRNGHILIDLAKRLSSYIEVRQVADDFKQFNEAFVILDKRGVIHQGQAHHYDAIAEYHNPRLASDLESTFEDIWNCSTIDHNFRQFHI